MASRRCDRARSCRRLRVFTIPSAANYFGRAALLAALYVVTGSLGLMLAVPPGYATIIWPASGRRAIPIFMNPAELAERTRTLSAELGENIAVGPEIFTRIPLRDGLETRAWTFVRKDQSRFPANVIITPLRDEHGAIAGFLGVIEDVSARHEVDRVKSEFTAVVSHELRTPLTSIRGSLGLILGAHGRIGFDSEPGKGATFWVEMASAAERLTTSR